MNLEELRQLEAKDRIKELKNQKKTTPEVSEMLDDWDYKRHDVMKPEKRPKRKVLVEEAELNPDGSIKIPARYKQEEVNRIALPLEQDIVNIHTAFTVGEEPTLELETYEDENKEDEQKFFKILKRVFKRNKIKYLNKKAVRSWLSECEFAEYWYTVDNENWWRKILHRVLGVMPRKQLKVAVWSPFRGDTLYPYFDDFGNMIAFSREYKTKDEKGNRIKKLMSIDDKNITVFVDDEEKESYPHGFDKIPVIYMHRKKPFCDKIKTVRIRLENLLSNFADCLDYNFAPKKVVKGEFEGVQNLGSDQEIIQLTDNAEVSYLTWQQSPEMAKVEFENLTERAYSLTNTPRISFENLKGSGNAFSGVAFKFAFMGIHLEVSNHAEVVEEYLQRRVNFLISAIGTMYPKMQKTAEMIVIDTEIVPYMIDNLAEKISNAVNATSGGVASLESGILLAGITDKVQEEKEKIKEEQNRSIFEPTEE